MNHAEKLRLLKACRDAVDYAARFPTLQAAWDACERPDWMLWLLGRRSGARETPERKRIVFIAAQCARHALPVYEAQFPSDACVRECIEACEAYSRGEIGLTELHLKKEATWRATLSASCTLAAFSSASAAVHAASISGSDFPDFASEPASAAAHTAAVAVTTPAYGIGAHPPLAAFVNSRKAIADIIRQHHPEAPTLP